MTSSNNLNGKRKEKVLSVKNMTKIGLLSAIAVVIMIIEIAIPIFPSFLKLDFSDVPALVAGFAMGPIAGVLVELIKNLFHVPTSGTGGVGELANFIIGCAYVVPASIIYRIHKTKKNAVYGMIVGAITMTLIGGLVNLFFLLPFYGTIMPMEAIIEMGSIIYSGVTDLKTLVIFGITPFNIFKGIVVSIVTYFVYKKISPILHK